MDEKGISRILVPVDGSDASDAAVRFAVQAARATGAWIDLLHVSYFDRETDAISDDSGVNLCDQLILAKR